MSGINFTEWSDQALTKGSGSTQVVTGPWVVDKASISSLIGNGLVNNQPVAAFLQQLQAGHQQLRAVANDLGDTYKASCAELRAHVDGAIDAGSSGMTLKYFDFDFALSHNRQVNAMHSFQAQSRHYLIVNAGCQSSLRMWNATTETFVELATFETGAIDTWIHVSNAPQVVHLITNGETNQSCSKWGAHIWTLNLERSTLDDSISLPHNFLSIQQKWNSSSSFYALRSDDWHVLEYDLNGNVLEEWIVFKNALKAPRFIPSEGNMGLALTDGKTLSLLASSRSEIKKRSANLSAFKFKFNPSADCTPGSKKRRCANSGPLSKCKLQQKFNELFNASTPKLGWRLGMARPFMANNARPLFAPSAGGSNEPIISSTEKPIKASFNRQPSKLPNEIPRKHIPIITNPVSPPIVQSANTTQDTSESEDPQVGATAGDLGRVVVDIIQVVGDILTGDFDYDEGHVELGSTQNGSDLSSPQHNSVIRDRIQLIAERIVDRIWNELWGNNDGNGDAPTPIRPDHIRPPNKNDSYIKVEDIRIAQKIVTQASVIMAERINSTIFQNRSCENASSPVEPVVGDYLAELQDQGIKIADRIAERILEEIHQNDEGEENGEEEVGDAFGDLQEQARKFADFLTEGMAETLQEDREDAENGDESVASTQLRSERKHTAKSDKKTLEKDVNKLVEVSKKLQKLVRKIQRKAMREKSAEPLVGVAHASNETILENTPTSTVQTPNNTWSLHEENESTVGDSIGKAITSRVINAENDFLPAHGQGEIVLVKVGPSQRALYAVTYRKDNVIKGDHDNIVVSVMVQPFSKKYILSKIF